MSRNLEDWYKLQREIITCQRCPRLANYVREVATTKVRRFQDHDYWGKPLPGFGDTEAELLIVGLAPAAHGGNRTGRMFTGDSSGDWLIRALYETGFTNQPTSLSREDGLILNRAFLTAPVRCAPPKNKPTSEEKQNCSPFLLKEWGFLQNIRIVLALGRIAFNSCLRYFYPEIRPRPPFQHGKEYLFPGRPSLIASYHPSRQNTQTGRLSWNDWKSVFTHISVKLDK